VWVESRSRASHLRVRRVNGGASSDGSSRNTVLSTEDTRKLVAREEIAASDSDGGTLVATLWGCTSRATSSAISRCGEAKDLSCGRDTTLELDGKDTLCVELPLAVRLVSGERGTELTIRGLCVFETTIGSVGHGSGILDTTITMGNTRLPDNRLGHVRVTNNSNIDKVRGVFFNWDWCLELK